MIFKQWSATDSVVYTPSVSFDGFHLNVQLAQDGSCYVCNDLSQSGYESTNPLKSMPRLIDILAMPLKLFSINLKHEYSWQQALAVVEASEVLNKTIFCSTHHNTILQLWSACHKARCGLLWEADEVCDIDQDTLSNLPIELMMYIPLSSALQRPKFWQHYQDRLIIWDVPNLQAVKDINLKPSAIIVNNL